MDSPTVAECNLDLLKNEKNSDVVFIVGEAKERISGHTFCLRARSSVFETMFADRWKSTLEIQEIVIPDVEPYVFRQFLQFIYGDKFITDVDEVINLLYVAHKYQVIPLIKRCEILIRTKMQLKDAISTYQTAKLYNFSALKKQAGDLIAKQFSTLIDHSTFQLMNEETLLDLLPRDDILVDELTLFNALLRWSKAQLAGDKPIASEQRRVLERILPLVRFPWIKVQDFAMTVIPKGILNSDESVALFTYMNSAASARAELRTKLGFPWKPRRPRFSQYSVYLYETHSKGQELKSLSFTKVAEQIDITEFSFTWSEESSSSGLNKIAFITSIVLRGPNYSSITNKRISWRSIDSWKVSMKLEKFHQSGCSSSCVILRARCLDSSKRKYNNLEIFSNKDTVVNIDPIIPLFVLQRGFKYRITVKYANPVYLPYGSKLGETETHDYLTSTKKKNNLKVTNKDGISEFKMKVLPSSDQVNYGGSESDSSDDERKPPTSSHCVRSIELKVRNY